MGVLTDRLIVDGEEYRLRSDGRLVRDLLVRLESGERPAAAVAPGAITPADVVAALAHDALGAVGEAGPPLVQSPPPRPRLERILLEPAWAEVFPDAPRPARLALVAGLLQVHDFWDASHEAAQQADDLGEREPPPTGTASPIAASPTPATPHTGSAASAATRSSRRWPTPPGHCSKNRATPPRPPGSSPAAGTPWR